jgi:hypothetical protein
MPLQETVPKFQVIDERDPIRPKYSIRPSDVPIRNGDVAGFFGKAEVEEAAGKLALFFQSKNAWVPFTIVEMVEFFQQRGWDPNGMFFGLNGLWYDDAMVFMITNVAWTESDPFIVLGCDMRYYVTDLFIKRLMEKPR